MAADLLTVKNLSISVLLDGGYRPVVKNLSFSVAKGSSVGIVGESGCGKSLTVSAILRLLPHPLARVDHGEMFF